jgi:fructokinase
MVNRLNMSEFIGIEGGGTKFVCAYGSGPSNLKDRVVIKTETPDIVISELVAYIRSIQAKVNIQALGLASFAPVDLDRDSATYGYITSTPKPGWGHCNIVGALQAACRLPIGFDTDVNGAALGEYYWGAARGVNDFVYLTVGTGIGGGAMMNGKLVHGAMHPEMGHLLVPQIKDDFFAGVCSYHHNCLEGLASGPAILKRWGVADAAQLAADHPAWELEAHYLALGLANIIMTCSPKKIILGGGVMHHATLLPNIRQQVLVYLNGYVSCKKIINDIDNYIVLPGLGDDSGVCGAIALAQEAQKEMLLSLAKERVVLS